MTVIYDAMRNNRDGKVRGSVRMKNGRLEAIITGCPEIAYAQDGDEFTFEFEAGPSVSDIPVRFRLLRHPPSENPLI